MTAKGRECDGDGEHGGSGRESHLSAELKEVQRTVGEERRRDVEGAIGREGDGDEECGEERHSRAMTRQRENEEERYMQTASEG